MSLLGPFGLVGLVIIVNLVDVFGLVGVVYGQQSCEMHE